MRVLVFAMALAMMNGQAGVLFAQDARPPAQSPPLQNEQIAEPQKDIDTCLKDNADLLTDFAEFFESLCAPDNKTRRKNDMAVVPIFPAASILGDKHV